MKRIILFATLFGFFFSCTKAPQTDDAKKANVVSAQGKAIYEGFMKDTVSNISDNLFLINDSWMLITAGNDTSFNTMTASWGGFGTVWNKPVAFMTVRDSRYTFEFLQREAVYTISFYAESYKEKMQMLGSKSGKNTEKIKESGLTPLKMPSGAMAYKEADMVIECKKLLSQPINPKDMADKDLAQEWYGGKHGEGSHNLFFGEIIGVWKKIK